MNRRDFLRTSGEFGMVGIASLAMPNILFSNAQNLGQNSHNLAQNLTFWGAPALISLTLAVAINMGNARKERDLKLRIWNSPDALRVGFASEDYKISAAPSNVGVNLANQGLDIKLLNILTTGLNYIFTRDEKVQNLSDLEGKNLIVPFKNDIPHIILIALCEKMGVDINKIKITFAANPPQAAQLFIAKDEFDAVLSQEPLASALTLMAKKNGKNIYRQISMQDLWKQNFGLQIPQAGLIVEGAFYEANKDFFALFHNDLKSALQWIDGNKDSAAKLGAKYLPAQEPAIKLAIPHSNLVAMRASEMAEDLMKFYEIIFEINPQFLGGKMPKKSLFL